MLLIVAMLPWWGLTARLTAAAPQANDIRISQIYGGGGNSGATYTHDFIELFNAGSTAVDLSGWSVQYASATGSTWQVTALSGPIGPGQYYLIQEAQGSGGTTPLPTPDAIGTIAMSSSNGKVALVNSTTALSGSCPTGVTDLVGYGTANCYEGGGATPALSNTTAAIRKAEGCADTDDNSADFITGAPTPRNTASPTHSCGTPPTGNLIVAKSGPATVLPGASYVYTLTVQNATGITLNNIVLSDTLPVSVTYASADPAGTWDPDTHTITWTQATLADNAALTCTLVVTAPTTWRTVTNADYAAWATEWVTPTSGAPVNTAVRDCGSIAAIQSNHDANGESLCKGSSVTVEGIVYAVYPSAGYAIADAAGPWHGLYIYTGSGGAKPLVGQRVRVTGTVAEYYSMTEIGSGSSFTVLSSGNTPYAASVVPVADIATGSPTAESYEGVLVEINNVTVDNPSLGSGEWSVTDGVASVRVDDLGYAYTPSLGDYLSVVRGMLNYSFSNFKIEPRDAADVVPGTATGLLIGKSGPITTTAGSTFSYTLVVRNRTATQLDDLVVSDTLPLSVTFASADPAGTWDPDTHTITWTQASVANSTVLTYTIWVTAPSEATLLTNREYAVWASDWPTRETGATVNTAVLAAGGVTPIGVARLAGPGWSGSLQGKVTVPPGIYRGNAFVIQDDTGGLYIYTGGTTLPAIALGDTVRVTGTLKLYNGLLEMDPMTGIANLGSGTPPAPRVLATGDVAANEGWLVQVTGIATWSNTPPVPGASDFTITGVNDGSGAVQVFVDKDTRIDMRGYTSGTPMTFIGFVSNYNGTRQIMPRYQSDVWDMLPPQVTATYPVTDATDVSPYFPITATFSKALDAATVTAATFTLEDALGPVAGAVSYDAGTRTATFDPAAALAPQTRYTATLTTGVQDTHGIPMAADYVWSFTTGDADTTPPTITGRDPAPDATEVPISANIVITFSEALDPATLTGHFTLSSPYGAVPVAMSYNAAAFVVTLDPTAKLLPTTRYTVTVAAEVADWAGLTLGAAETWSFQTAAEPPMSAYHGDIHNHTSYSDGSGTPTEALAAGKAAGFDFMAITDHSYKIDDAKWADTLAAVNAATQNGVFVALRGFEYTQGAEGHINVYNTVRHAVRTTVADCTYCDYTPNLEAGVTVQGFYPWLAITGTQAIDDAGTVMQFNHPGWINFNDWTYHPEVGDTARLEEVGNGSGTSYAFSEEEYIRSLDYGWKVGATNNADTHSTSWGTNTPHRTGVWMRTLTRSDLLEALRERRTFATEDANYALYIKGNGAWMGTEIPNTGQIVFEVYANDPDGEAVGTLELVTNGGQVVTATTVAQDEWTWQFALSITPGVHYYYVRATQPDGDRIVSSPIWTQGTENIAITDLTVEPSLLTIYNPSLITARVTNRGATTQTVTVTFSVNGEVVGAVPLTVGTCTVGPCSDGYANISWQPTAIGPVTVTAQFAPVPADNPDDNSRSLALNVTNEKVPLVLIDAGHNNIGTSNPRDARHFVNDLTAHGYNVLFNLDEITPSDLNTETVKLLIINAYGPDQLTDDEIAAIAGFVAAGGSLWLNGMSDYTGKVPWANTVADLFNALIAAIERATGAQIPIRLNDDEVLDGNNNNSYPWGVLWHVYPAANETGIGINVEQIQSWSDCSLTDRNKSALTQADLGANGFIIIRGDLDTGNGTYGYPNRTHGTDADGQGDAYIYPTDTPLAGAAGYDIPGVAGRLFFYGDSNDPFNIFAYTAGDGKQNELFNLETTMWLLGEPLRKSTIAQARADAELNNTPDNLDKLVWVEGKITAAYGEFFNVLYVQDETGGITVHAPAGDISATQFTRGTTVRVVGTVGAYNGDTEIEFFEAEMVQVLAPSTGEVAPRPFTTGGAALEINEGWLAQITGTVTSRVGDEAIWVDDGSGPVRAFLDGYNGNFGDIAVGDIVTVKGLISEDGDGRRIRVRNYKMHPSIADDVIKLGVTALMLDKSVMPTVGTSPATFTYTLLLANSGPVNAPDVVITDALPAELTFGGFVAANGASYADGVITWHGVAPTASPVTIVFTATANVTGQVTQTVTNTAYFAGPGVAGSDSAAVQVVPPVLPVIVTEFLPDPLAVADTAGEWLELYNPNPVAVDLKGWKLSDLGTNRHTITRTVTIPAGGFVVLGNNADPLTNGGVDVAYQYSSFTLANTSDEIILTDALGREVDLVAYVSNTNDWPRVTAGRAFQICNPLADNNVGSNWSLASVRWASGSDYGSPGQPNLCGVLTISKSVFPQTAVPLGSVITYTITVANTGSGDAAPVRVVDVLPRGVTGAALDWTGVITANTSVVFTIPAVVTTATEFYGQALVNTATYTYFTLSESAAATVTLATAPQLTLTKTVTPTGDVFPGDVVTYTLTLHNSGETPTSGIALTDTLPWELDFAAWVTQSGAAVADDVITWSGDLAGGASLVISFRAVVRSDSFFLAHPVVNTATYTANGLPDGSASATFMLGGVVAPVLAKTVTTPNPVFPGDTVTYTLTLNNPAGMAGGVVLTDILPVEVDFDGWVVQNDAILTNGVITWSGNLEAGASLVISFRATLHADSLLYGTTITNTAAFVALNALPGTATAVFTVAPQPTEPLLRLNKTVQTNGEPLPGESVVYTLTLANLGGDATGVALTDTLPVALDFGGWIAQDGAGVADDVITWSGDLAAGTSRTLVFTATLHSDPALYGQTITNTVQATADNADEVTAEAAFTVGSGGVGNVTITKDVAATTVVDAGDVVTYTITLANSGDAPATGVLLTDTLPVEVDFGGWIAQNGATVTADMLTWSGDLAAGTTTFVFTATVRSDVALDGHTVVNTARFTWGATGAEDTAGFTLRRMWQIFLPLTTRNF